MEACSTRSSRKMKIDFSFGDLALDRFHESRTGATYALLGNSKVDGGRYVFTKF